MHGVPEGRYTVAHRACPERNEGEAVGKFGSERAEIPTGVTLELATFAANNLVDFVNFILARRSILCAGRI